MLDGGACLTADDIRHIARRLVESLSEILGLAVGQGDVLPGKGGGEIGASPPRSR
ncbi:hypothetical protein OG978_20835 [Streptomyces sp. NBC_01591]|uniref:hypothetical protein n=1 Tax=Streptomyces sp. NBC_01591 TaxID=2975888 RepID=UPI002DD934D9|nr:hypothetical protein [Streptomyces sp. NBC_01591]WSD69618.1 hypothetical protein OG978_20835 [Streptomyces sp. NBC_01591]